MLRTPSSRASQCIRAGESQAPRQPYCLPSLPRQHCSAAGACELSAVSLMLLLVERCGKSARQHLSRLPRPEDISTVCFRKNLLTYILEDMPRNPYKSAHRVALGQRWLGIGKASSTGLTFSPNPGSRLYCPFESQHWHTGHHLSSFVSDPDSHVFGDFTWACLKRDRNKYLIHPVQRNVKQKVERGCKCKQLYLLVVPILSVFVMRRFCWYEIPFLRVYSVQLWVVLIIIMCKCMSLSAQDASRGFWEHESCS